MSWLSWLSAVDDRIVVMPRVAAQGEAFAGGTFIRVVSFVS